MSKPFTPGLYLIVEGTYQADHELFYVPSGYNVHLTQLAINTGIGQNGFIVLWAVRADDYWPIARLDFTYDKPQTHSLMNALLPEGIKVVATVYLAGFCEFKLIVYGELIKVEKD